MKTIFSIAKAELRNLIYSPVAWFLAVAFFLQCSMFYHYQLKSFVMIQDSMLNNDITFNGFGKSLTHSLFLSGSGVFTGVIGNLYLFLPLLTMGLISREVSSGSYVLLATSPIKIRYIVFGKYLAVVVYNLILIGLLLIMLVFGHFSILNMDWGLIASALFGIFLLICSYSAIGIYMSSLTTYQIVAAVAVFLTIFGLNIIGGIWQEYDIVREITYFLSMRGRTSKMLGGLITSRDFIYFVLIIAMFLFFTLLKLKSKTESRPWYILSLRYLFVVFIVLTVGFFTNKPQYTLYYDLSRNQINTLHPNVQKVVQEFEKEEPIKVTLYANLLGGGFQQGGIPSSRNAYIHQFWDYFLRFKSNIEFEYVYYYDISSLDSMTLRRFPNKDVHEIAELQAKAYDIDINTYLKPEEIRQIIDLDKEGKRVVMELEYKGKKTFARTFDDPMFWPNEINMAAAFKRLQQEEMPIVYYTSGNLERNIFKMGEREYAGQSTGIFNRSSLINLGFDVDTINLEHSDIPENISYLVVADPKVELSDAEVNRLNEFLSHGGNAFFLGEPGKQELLNPLLQPLGVSLGKGTLIELTRDEMPHMVIPFYTREALSMSEKFQFVIKAINEGRYVDTPRIYMPGAVPLFFDDASSPFQKLSIFETISKRNTFSKVGKFVVDSISPRFLPEEGDYKMPVFQTMLGLTRNVEGKEQRIIVAGDADFGSNIRRGGGDFTTTFAGWLNYGEFPIVAPKDMDQDVQVTINPQQMKFQSYILVWIIPGLLILFGTVLLIRRKRK
jgi:ABC-2 type transport system permease protein